MRSCDLLYSSMRSLISVSALPAGHSRQRLPKCLKRCRNQLGYFSHSLHWFARVPSAGILAGLIHLLGSSKICFVTVCCFLCFSQLHGVDCGDFPRHRSILNHCVLPKRVKVPTDVQWLGDSQAVWRVSSRTDRFRRMRTHMDRIRFACGQFMHTQVGCKSRRQKQTVKCSSNLINSMGLYRGLSMRLMFISFSVDCIYLLAYNVALRLFISVCFTVDTSLHNWEQLPRKCLVNNYSDLWYQRNSIGGEGRLPSPPPRPHTQKRCTS